MKAFILTEGGKNIGFGHITRTLSLYQALNVQKIKAKFIVNGNSAIKNLLQGVDYDIFNWLEKKDRLFSLLSATDIVIVDSYLADSSFYYSLSKLIRIPVYIDDNNRLNYPRGIVVNGSICADRIRYKKKSNQIYILGARYAPLRRQFWRVPPKRIRKNIKTLLLTFGGSNHGDYAFKVLRLLSEDYPHLVKRVIVGNDKVNFKHLAGAGDIHTEFICSPSAELIKEIMLDCDFAISGSGQTLYELARVGTPTIAVIMANNQVNNVWGFKDAGFIKSAIDLNEKNSIEKISHAIELLTDRGTRERLSISGKKNIDGAGAIRLVKKIYAIAL